MDKFFKDVWERIKKTVEEELQDLSYMEIVTATSENVSGHIDNEGWDILDSLRRGKAPSEYDTAKKGEMKIKSKDVLNLSNIEILARTRIELDGDVFNLLKDKGESLKIKADAMELHKLGIGISVQNWQYFLEFVLELTTTIGVVVGGIDESKFSKISKATKR